MTGVHQPRPIALVTGASSGIGRAFAEILASRGHDLVVVARDTDRLEQLSRNASARHQAHVEVLPADLGEPQALARVEERIRSDPQIGTVINNAGFGTAGEFASMPIAPELGQVAVNIVAVIRLSHVALATMIPRRTGRLLNVSSVGGLVPGPGNATYSATKAFVTSFTESLHEEAKPHGLHVTCLCPGFTRTEFQERAGVSIDGVPRFGWQSAETVALSGLEALDRNEALCVTGWLNKLTVGATHLAPRSLVRRAARAVIERL